MEKTILRKYVDQKSTEEGYTYWCPGCKLYHGFKTINPKGRPVWTFDGNLEKPTVKPSLVTRFPKDNVEQVCHCFIRNGEIQFLTDCTHELAGKTVPMEPND